MRGLRGRLVVAFVVVGVLGAGVAAWASAVSARDALLEQDRRETAAAVTGRVATIAPTLDLPPGRVTLDRLRDAVGEPVLVVHGDRRSADGLEAGIVPGELRAAVAGGDRLVTQRVVADGTPWLLVGTPVVATAPDGTRSPSGIEVYAARDLTGVQERIDGLTVRALATAALVLPLAVLLALLAARSVLRPVRDLRDTARRLAAGDLAARTPPRGTDELAELTDTLNEMAESLQTSMTATTRLEADARRFAADVSHELRTPLATLTAVMEVLDGVTDTLAPDAREAAGLAVTETHRLVRLVEDLMEVSRFDAGTARLQVQDTDARAVVRETLRTRGWTGRVALLAAGPVPGRFDPRRVDVVVANLVGNALRHGGPPVVVRVSGGAGGIRIEVSDDGPGLSDDVVEHVFDRFYKADAARTRSGGSGLGLAIARENARLHGGDLTARAGVGGGARFVLELPWSPVQEPADPREPAREGDRA
ncbi:HAMP domain-containing sensor histidine kinase [Myceligenerans cantabricum]